MNRTPSVIASCVVVAAVISSISALAAVGTGFTYQAQLRLDGSPVNAICTFTFKLFDAGSAGTQVGGTLNQSFNVNSGQFTIQLDFGAVFQGDARWLEIMPNCGAGAVTLSPRQALTPTPYALFASTASIASTSTSAATATIAISATNFTGTLAGDVSGLQSSTSVVVLTMPYNMRCSAESAHARFLSVLWGQHLERYLHEQVALTG